MIGTGACSLGVANDGGFGSATLASEGSNGGASASGTEDTGGSDDESAGNSSDPSDSGDPSAPTGMDDGDPTAGGEVCNGLDDDGDGEIDENVPELACGIGTCEVTLAGCEGGVPAQCFPGSPGVESCNGLDDDCDGSSDEELVQACASACGAGSQSCTGGAWSACDAPPPQAEACNIVDDDCNGGVDDGVPGCRVWVHRWYHPVTGEHFYSTDATEGLCCGFQLEFMNYFQLYAGAQADVTGLYRCYGANGFHHYTTDPFCEGLPGN
ncbi:MAG: hypothetical protein IAG13_22895, partial [Deltaproteobacteria bacterium]|nr:hypothetical protein [Nannocystaceae bacterium]